MTSKLVDVSDVELWLNEIEKNLANQFNIYEEGNHLIVKPKNFLGKELFAKVARKLEEHKGEYISAHKDSRFQFLLRKEEKAEAKPDIRSRLIGLRDELDRLINELKEAS